MGMAPTEVDRQSLWQFSAAWNGYVGAHSSQQGGAKLTAAEVDELFDWIDQPPSAAEPKPLRTVIWTGERLILI